MFSVKIGSIIHDSKGNYRTSMFEGRETITTSEFHDSYKFAREKALELINTNEINAVSIEYKRIDGRKSYLIFEKFIDLNNEEKLLEFEESRFDYEKMHAESVKTDPTRKLINERYYSFHDVARIRALTSYRNLSARKFLYGLGILASLVLLFWGLHFIFMSPMASQASDNEKVLGSTLVIGSSIAGLGINILALISYVYPSYILRKKDNDFDDIDWRKLNWIRSILKISAFILMVPLFFSITLLFIFIGKSSLWEGWTISSEAVRFIISASVFAIALIFTALGSLYNSAKNNKWSRKWLGIYFNKNERKNLRRWLKYKSEKVAYKTDHKYFVYKLEEIEFIIHAKLKAFEEIRSSSTDQEIRMYKEKSQANYLRGIEVLYA